MSDRLDTLAKRIRSVAENSPNYIAQMSKNGGEEFSSVSYRELYEQVKALGTRLAELGIERGEHVGLISDNRREWIIIDLAIIGLGAVDVPRGSDSTEDELAYILGHADCRTVFVENQAQIDKILKRVDDLPKLERIVSMDPVDTSVKKNNVEIVVLTELLEEAKKSVETAPDLFNNRVEEGTAEETVTIIYTSGTTGEPKGVMLSNRNYVFQLERIYEHVAIKPGDIFLSVLPSWHSFERAVEYVVLNIGATLAYSKMVGTVLMADMAVVRPNWTAAVPRLWEGVRSAVFRNAASGGVIKEALFRFFVWTGELHATMVTMVRGLMPQFKKRNTLVDALLSAIPLVLLTPIKLLGNLIVFRKIKAKLGGRFIAGISGGGKLPTYVDRFYRAAGITLLEGYGLTETAPVLSVRKLKTPVPGTVGPLLRDIEYLVLAEDGTKVRPGQKGVLYVKSDQVMKGYYKRQEATEAVLQDGWLNTGDIVIFTHTGEFTIIGREKETIVLLGGENVEPTPIEDALSQSEYIDQIMVVGQDQKFLGALIVPNREILEKTAEEMNFTYFDYQELLDNQEIQSLIYNEIQSAVSAKNGFKAFERVFRFKLIPEPFEVGEELTHTLKVKRNVVSEKYAPEINEIFG